jgi:hypothetical protein
MDTEFYLLTETAVVRMKQELEKIVVALKNRKLQLDIIVSPQPILRQLGNHEWHYSLIINRKTLIFQFSQEKSHSTSGSTLTVSLFAGMFNPDGGMDVFYKQQPVALVRYRFDVDARGVVGWADEKTGKDFLPAEQLAEFWFRQQDNHAFTV